METVEDFWSLADHIKPPSELMAGVDYSFFKNGIRPMWEDPQNVKGKRVHKLQFEDDNFIHSNLSRCQY